MNKIGIVCDSTSYLDNEYIVDKDITIVNLSIIVDGEAYTDGVDIDNSKLFEYIDNGKSVTTSQPAPENFLDAFNKMGEKYSKIICFTLSSGLSGTYNSACIAKSLYEGNAEIEIVDTKTSGMGIRACIDEFLIIKDAVFASAVNKLRKIIDNSKTLLTIDDLQTLVKTGRMKKSQAIIGNIMVIKPLLELDENGKVQIFSKIRTQKILLYKICELAKEANAKKVYISFVGSKDVLSKTVDTMKDRLQGIELVPCGEIGPVLSLHLGRGGIGVFYKKH